MTVQIEFANTQDIAAIIRLLGELANSLGQTTSPTEEFITEYLTNPNSKILLARIDHKVVGMLSFTIRPTLLQNGYDCRIEEFIVNWGFRNKGIGIQLLEEASQEAKKAGCCSMSMATATQNRSAIHFFGKRGFMKPVVQLKRDSI